MKKTEFIIARVPSWLKELVVDKSKKYGVGLSILVRNRLAKTTEVEWKEASKDEEES